MKDFNKRLVEVDEILKHLSIKELAKIPEEIKTMIKENKDKEYKWYYDKSKPLKDQNLNRDTISILSYLNMEYLLNEEQKKLMKKMLSLNEQKLEEEKKEKYNSQDIFKDKRNIKQISQENQLIEYKENIFTKILSFIKKVFQRK